MTFRPLLGAIVVAAVSACPANPVAPPATDAALVPPVDAGAADAAVHLRDAGSTDAGTPDSGGCPGGCGAGERCSVLGLCYTGECLAHPDCEPAQRCREGRCLPRVRAEFGIVFERLHLDTLDQHHAPFPDAGLPPGSPEANGQVDTMGFGAALFDMDGDLDLDLFIGSQGSVEDGASPACIYRNESLPANPRFTPIEAHCQRRPNTPHAGFGIDLEGDGYHELILGGIRLLQLQRFAPEPQVVDLLALLPEGDERRDCNIGSAVNLDLNFDGKLDLVIGCHFDFLRSHGESVYHLVFVQTPNGDLRFLTRAEWDRDEPVLMHAEGSTLGLGAADLNDDGLLDLLVSEDTGTAPPNSDGNADDGGVYVRCAPNAGCRFSVWRLGEELRAFGAFMGSGVLQVEGAGEHVYFSDWGANRLVASLSRPPQDRAQRSGAGLAGRGAMQYFSWGVVVDDFNRDGRDDLLVGQGSVFTDSARDFDAHFDALLLQDRRGQFSVHSDDVGLTPFSRDDSRSEDRVFASRALLKADLDGDGFMDIVGLGMEGSPRLHREVPSLQQRNLRCTLVPVDRWAPGYGTGHALIPPGGQPARKWDSQGQLRSGTSPFVLSPWTQGRLRFPSGAAVPFDCRGDAGPLIVSEPDWLQIERQGDALSVRVSEVAPSGSLTLLAMPSGDIVAAQETSPGSFSATLPAGTDRVMLRFGQRWVPRWF